MVLKLCDAKWDGISKEIDLQQGPFGEFVLSHVSTFRLIVSDMAMVASLQPRARYTGEKAFEELMPNIALTSQRLDLRVLLVCLFLWI